MLSKLPLVQTITEKACAFNNNDNNNYINIDINGLLTAFLSTVPVLPCEREKRGLGPVVTCCNPLLRTMSTRNGHNNINGL